MPRNLSPFFSAGMKRPDPRPARALIEELEPRLLYSADFAPALADALAPQVEQRIIGIDGNFTNTTDSLQQAQHIQLEVVFLDLSVQGYQQILADIHEQNTSGRSIEVVLLDAERDGVEQIGDFLRQHQNIDAIHVISHGSDGEIQLGTTTLNLDSLLKNATLIKAWGNSLNADADILLYGCDVAQSADGRALVDALSRLTGADVAASDDLTGNAVLGGDWALEYHLGAIEARVAISAQAQAGFEGVLLSPVGTETLANTTTSNIQDNSVNNVSATALFGGPRSVASDASGNFVMVWDSFLQDGSGWGIYAQRFDATGAKAGAEFQVNSTTANNQVYSSVAMATNGNFLVTWTSTPDAGGDTGVYAQLYNAAGTAIGGQLLVNTTTTGRQQWSSAAFDDSGNSLVTWASAAQDGSGYGIYAQRFNATGSMLGGEFQVNTTTANDQLYPSVAMAANGNFVETWTSAAQDGSGTGIYAQRFDAAGTKLGAEFRVNATTANDQLYSRVATDASGNFVIVWQSASQDGGGTGVYAQRYDAAGTALGANFKVNTTTANDQSFPNIAMAPTGEFVVAWASSGQDGNGWGIYAQNYDASGSAVGSEYLVNTTTAGDQLYPSLAMPSARSVIVAWSGNGTGDNDGMYFQRYMNAAPVLNSTKSPTLTSQNEDAGAPVGAGGTLVSSLVDFAAPAGQIDNVTDPDSGALLGIAVTAADATNGSWWYSINGGTNWSGLGTVSDASARLLTADANTRLYFQPNADWNGTITHAITFRAWDQTSGSNGALGDTTVNGGNAAFSTATDTASLVINAVNDAPVVTTTGTALAYTENQAATAIDGALTVSDVDSANLTGATVTISANYANGEDVLAFTNQNGITGSWSVAAGILTLSGTTTVANYQTALHSITYVNTGENPSTLTRTVSFVVNDGAANSTAATCSISVAAVNDAPTATNLSAGQTYTEDTPLGLTAIVVSDVDSATVTVTLTLSAPAAGSLSAGTSGAVTSTYNAGTGVWTASGAITNVNTLLAGLSFTPSPNYNSNFTIATSVSDDSLSVTGSKVMTGTAVDDPATIGGTISYVGNEGDAVSGTLTATDVDGLTDGTIFSVTMPVANGTAAIDAATGAWTFAPTDANWFGTDSFTVTVTDDLGGTTTQMIDIMLNQVNIPGEAASPALIGTDPVDTPYSAAPDAQATVESSVSTAASTAVVESKNLLIGKSGLTAANTLNGIENSARVIPLKVSELRIYKELPLIHQELITAETRDEMLMRLLKLIQAEVATSSSGNNTISPAIRVEISQEDGFQVEVFRQGAQIAAVSLSVGAVWWALRVGGLFASLLTSLPAWRSFDMLPVLSRDKDEDENEPDLALNPKKDKPAVEASKRLLETTS